MKEVELSNESEWQRLQQWRRANSHILQEYELSRKTGQELHIKRSFFESHEFHMYRLTMHRCQVCHYRGREKYLRIRGDQGEKGSGVLVICKECFLAKDEELPCRIQR